MWGKILLIATAATVVTGAAVGPTVYYGLAGQFLLSVAFRTSKILKKTSSCR